MVCDDLDVVKVPGNQHIQVTNVQIVNGCQTTVTLRDADKEGLLRDGVHVLVRIYATQDPMLVEKITVTTNNQNKITDRDLRANDDVQKNVQKAMRELYDYDYERKTKEFGEKRGERKKKGIIPNQKAAQAYFAIVKKRPSVARGFPGRVWSEYYDDIFKNATVEDLLVCYKLYSYCYEQARNRSTETAVYGAFHIARIMGNLLLHDKWGNENKNDVTEIIELIEADDSRLDDYYEHGTNILDAIWQNDISEDPVSQMQNPTLYFKAEKVQLGIERTLAEMRQR